MDPWQEQFERVKRYLLRMWDRERKLADYEDDVWSFFQNSWRLKDWIKERRKPEAAKVA